MRSRRCTTGALVALLVAAAPVAVAHPAGAAPADVAAAPVPGLVMKGGPQPTRFGASSPSASSRGLNDVPDDQVVCGVGGTKPTWSPKPTVYFGLTMRCNGRWVRGSASLYLFYRFSASDSWALAAKKEYVPLPGGDSSTLVIEGLSHTLAPCFPAYWYGQVYVEATFYAGNPMTDSAWFGTTSPDPFLSC
jgi:hypothetical protein